jgi:hypothetical protein
MACFKEQASFRAAAALEYVTLIVVLKKNFMLMTKTQSQILYRLARVLPEHIRFSCKNYRMRLFQNQPGFGTSSNAMIKETIGRIYNYLALIFEKDNRVVRGLQFPRKIPLKTTWRTLVPRQLTMNLLTLPNKSNIDSGW